MIRRFLLAALICLVPSFAFACGAGSVVGTQCRAIFASGGTFTVPYDWNNSVNKIEGIGPGGNGGGSNGIGNGGGGGGAYCSDLNADLQIGGSITITINAANSGGVSSFGSILSAPGGAPASGQTGGVGGNSASCVGNGTGHSGGTGGSQVGGAGQGGGAGGGGAGGPNGAGNGGASTGGSASEPGGSGDAGFGGAGGSASGGGGGNGAEWGPAGSGGGGGGGNPSAGGASGGAYGSGGGGSGFPVNAEGPGVSGVIVVTYTPTTSAFQIVPMFP